MEGHCVTWTWAREILLRIEGKILEQCLGGLEDRMLFQAQAKFLSAVIAKQQPGSMLPPTSKQSEQI